jgi:hypothetical protein
MNLLARLLLTVLIDQLDKGRQVELRESLEQIIKRQKDCFKKQEEPSDQSYEGDS